MRKLKRLTTLTFIMFMAMMVVSYASAEEPLKININTAPLEELVKLNKVGPKYAQRIIDYREKVARFSQPEDIMNVKGIGLRTYEANSKVIAVK